MNKELMIKEELEYKVKKLERQIDELQKIEERYKLVIEGSSNGLWDWDLITDTVYISKVWREMLGFEERKTHQYYKKWTERIHPKDVKRATSTLHSCFKEKSQFYICEYRIKLNEGKYIWVSSKGKLQFNDKGEPVRITGSHTDITEKKKMEEKLERLVYYDQLTGTIIRTAFMDKLKISIEEAKKEGLMLSVLFLDVDNFKTVNDMYGHNIGDLFLKKIATRIKSCIRNIDILCRIGGDEFAILLPHINGINEADEIAQRILDSFNYTLIVKRYKLSSSISIGIAVYPDNGRNGKVLLEKADIAMYKAKEEGKNNLRHFNNYMMKEIGFRNNIGSDLKDAIDNGELFLCYQPIIDARTKRVVRMEALIRWKHLKKGIISPVDFIPVAEETKLIIPIGEWVLKSALKQLKEWHEAGFKDFRLSVNASVVQLQKPDFAKDVSKLLEEEGISAKYIELEITESALIDSVYNLSNNLKLLREQGIKVSIDDFGTGYNSLKYIQKFNVDCIKIDRTFVSNVNDERNKIIISHIISLGHSIDAEIIAEGVETKEQYEYLKEQCCDTIQGYYFSKPLLPEEAIEFLRENSNRSFV
ncbi:GGDEF and EAL domain-containing protein [Clostridium sp. YIM B02551]|uniref:bifunctional diguanylate cyclase/phosphodiesterase n=1 Tax=Clostridium sp. YIM B02551 TaxID=2910679 RepID=UPI001EEBD791|nr:GGDEF and EAL domain-containing protein [Clostridium sp. YIM B02551]